MRLVLALLVNCLLLITWPLWRWRRAWAASRGAWLELEVDGAPIELGRAGPRWQRRPGPVSLQDLRVLVELATRDARVAGLLVKIRSVGGATAGATALGEVLQGARRRGLPVVAYLPAGGGSRELLVACAADRVLLGPETHLGPLGFAVQAHYVKDALDRIGLQAEVFARGRYKSAGEPLTRNSMSAEQREQLEAYLDVTHDLLVDTLARGRSVSRSRAEQWVDEGVWSARAAVIQGLADGMAHEDQLPDKLSRRDGSRRSLQAAGRYLRRRAVRWRPLVRPRHIAVVEIHGPIAPGRSSGLVPLALEQDVIESLRRAAEDRRVAGVVLHVNSPGGSALSSQLILHEVRRLAAKKPVAACLGAVAASGGYLIACGAEPIYAQPSSLTGSIGVVAAHVVLQPLLERIGVGVEVVQRGSRANMYSPARRLEPAEREVLERQMDDVYQAFVQAVASGRHLALQQVESLAGGRIYSGRDAAARGLVDALGGLDDAVTAIRQRLGPRAQRMEPRRIGPRPAWFRVRALGGLVEELAAMLGVRPLGCMTALTLRRPSERVWLYCPLSEGDSAPWR